jgi:hypothetical protein
MRCRLNLQRYKVRGIIPLVRRNEWLIVEKWASPTFLRMEWPIALCVTFRFIKTRMLREQEK